MNDTRVVLAIEHLTDKVLALRLAIEANGHNSTGRGGLSDKQVEKGSIPLCPTNPDSDGYVDEDEKITDGFGSVWSITCAQCHKPTMQVVRPGKAQCGSCG